MSKIQNIIAERNILRVATDLQEKGYTVYRIFGDPSAPALHVKETGSYIAVKTGRARKNGSAYCPHKVPYDYNILALVVGDRIVYNDWHKNDKG